MRAQPSPVWHVAFVCKLLSSLLLMTLAQQLHKEVFGSLLLLASATWTTSSISVFCAGQDWLGPSAFKKAKSFTFREFLWFSWELAVWMKWAEKRQKEEQKGNKASEVREFVKGKVCQRVFELYNVVFPCLEFTQKTLIYQEFSDWKNSFFSRH